MAGTLGKSGFVVFGQRQWVQATEQEAHGTWSKVVASP